VAPGDTLAAIAERFNTTVAELRQMNGLADAGIIRVGQELIVGPGQQLQRLANRQTTLDVASLYGVSAAQLAAWDARAHPSLTATGDEPPPAARVAQPKSSSSSTLTAPYRSQFDGSPYEQANCGPAALGILMGANGQHWTTLSIRRSVEQHSGVKSFDTGSSWEDLAEAAQKRGFDTLGLFNGMGGYKEWNLDDLLKRVTEGRPVMLLARFWSLPGHDDKGWGGDHYIIFLGTNPQGEVIYHDTAWRGTQGAYLTMSREQLERAWTRVSVGIQKSAVFLAR
jgi:LysM repeat protein